MFSVCPAYIALLSTGEAILKTFLPQMSVEQPALRATFRKASHAHSFSLGYSHDQEGSLFTLQLADLSPAPPETSLL